MTDTERRVRKPGITRRTRNLLDDIRVALHSDDWTITRVGPREIQVEAVGINVYPAAGDKAIVITADIGGDLAADSNDAEGWTFYGWQLEEMTFASGYSRPGAWEYQSDGEQRIKDRADVVVAVLRWARDVAGMRGVVLMSPAELRARRLALGLSQRGLADAAGVAQNTVSTWETGTRRIPAGVASEVEALEARAEALAKTLVDEAAGTSGIGEVVLRVWPDDEALWAANPELRGLPTQVHHVATVRAAARLRATIPVVRIEAATVQG